MLRFFISVPAKFQKSIFLFVRIELKLLPLFLFGEKLNPMKILYNNKEINFQM